MICSQYCKWVKEGLMVSLLFLMAFGIASCKPDKYQDINQSNLMNADTIVNEFAKAFQIIYRQNDTKINIVDPLSQQIIQSYTISDDNSNNSNVITLNINRIVTMATSQVGVLREFHLENKIVGIANFNDLCHPLNKTKVKELGYMQSANPENFIEVHPDVIFYSGFDLSDPILSKLDQAGLKTFLIYDWKETHPLGRAEWIKVFGILLNQEKQANAIFNKIKNQYNDVVKKLNQAERKPTVLAGTYFSGVFNAPAGESYMSQLLKDANANYVYGNTKGTGSLSLSLEEVITENKNSDYWLNAAASSKYDLMEQSKKFRLLKATKQSKLYSYFENRNCFFEKASTNPQLVLEDLGKILHPELFADKELNFYSVLGQ